jgi:hypothetical protein
MGLKTGVSYLKNFQLALHSRERENNVDKGIFYLIKMV